MRYPYPINKKKYTHKQKKNLKVANAITGCLDVIALTQYFRGGGGLVDFFTIIQI